VPDRRCARDAHRQPAMNLVRNGASTRTRPRGPSPAPTPSRRGKRPTAIRPRVPANLGDGRRFRGRERALHAESNPRRGGSIACRTTSSGRAAAASFTAGSWGRHARRRIARRFGRPVVPTAARTRSGRRSCSSTRSRPSGRSRATRSRSTARIASESPPSEVLLTYRINLPPPPRRFHDIGGRRFLVGRAAGAERERPVPIHDHREDGRGRVRVPAARRPDDSFGSSSMRPTRTRACRSSSSSSRRPTSRA